MHLNPLLCLGIVLIHIGLIPISEGRAESQNNPESPRLVAIAPIVTEGLESPVYLAHAGDGSGRLFLVEQPGRIRILERETLLPTPFLDITEQVLPGGERGLLGLAFHPNYRHNGRFFVYYTRKPDGATIVAEYRRAAIPTTASPDGRVLLLVQQPYPNHNGGMMSFGPDGYLYIGLGDGGSKGDPENRAQDRQELLGKLLRIDVDHGELYGIPPDNPFAVDGGRPEIYALGLRNPWRFSFDIKTGHLWVADVGQYKWEEIDLVTRGGNYGWRVMEGTHCFQPAIACRTTTFSPPILEYSHDKGRCSIIGGYVYRGKALPSLVGTYVYGDFCSGEIFAMPNPTGSRTLAEVHVLLKTTLRLSSFGEDASGELYVLDHRGGVYRLSHP